MLLINVVNIIYIIIIIAITCVPVFSFQKKCWLSCRVCVGFESIELCAFSN